MGSKLPLPLDFLPEEFSMDVRRGCFLHGPPQIIPGVAYFNWFGGLFYFYFLIGQVWWTFLFLFFYWPGGMHYQWT